MCIGITKKFPYIKNYGLDGILGPHLAAIADSTEVLRHYTFVGADNELVYRVLEFGYLHEGEHDIHDQIIVTLIFQRKLCFE